SLTLYSRSFLANHTTPTAFYTLSLHDALPISRSRRHSHRGSGAAVVSPPECRASVLSQYSPTSVGGVSASLNCLPTGNGTARPRSEEHTSELQSRENLVCRLLLEKKKKKTNK